MPWVDFKQLRESLDFTQLLDHYGVELTVKGDRATGFCPLPTHGGRRNSPSFSAHLLRGVWQCFGCGAKGNLLDFAARMEGFDPTDPKAFLTAALRVQEKFAAAAPTGAAATPPKPAARPRKARSAKPVRPHPEPGADTAVAKTGHPEVTVIVNAPIDFELKRLDAGHPYLRGRGLSPETIAHFGLGYCARGLFTGRVVIPLHDATGVRIGYAGRLADDARIGADAPKYLFPPPRERDGRRYEFRKGLMLYNGFAAGGPLRDLIVVEGFMSVFWLWQCGFPNVVALMGSSCSDEQAELIVRGVEPLGRVWVMPDGDDTGERCADSVLPKVAPHRFVRRLRLAAGRQPTDCSAGELRQLLQFGAQKSGTPDEPLVAKPASESDEKAGNPTAAV